MTYLYTSKHIFWICMYRIPNGWFLTVLTPLSHSHQRVEASRDTIPVVVSSFIKKTFSHYLCIIRFSCQSYHPSSTSTKLCCALFSTRLLRFWRILPSGLHWRYAITQNDFLPASFLKESKAYPGVRALPESLRYQDFIKTFIVP